MVQDMIEREIVVAAPVERVWAAVTEAQHLGVWFGDAGATIDLRPGGALSLTWREHGTAHGRVEEVDAPHRFVCRWGNEMGEEPTPGNSTRVEFTLTADGDTTRLRVVESGFASLDRPDEEKAASVAGNTEGWASELAELQEYAPRMAA